MCRFGHCFPGSTQIRCHCKVYRVAVVYTVAAVAVVEAADLFRPRRALPDWTVTLVVVLTVLGFPIALVLAWAFEITPEGVRRTTEVRDVAGRSGPSDSTDPERGIARRVLIGLGLLAIVAAAGWYVVGGEGGPPPERREIRSLAVLPLENLAREPEVQES